MSTFLHVIFFLCTFNDLQSILYDTDQFGFDCLHYFSTESEFSEIVKYCIRPKDDMNSIMIEFFNISDDYLTFDQLYRLNITSHEILLWSSSIDLAEQYEYYLDQPIQSNLSNEKFFNCTRPWFGSRCQYSFKFNEDKLVQNPFEIVFTDDIFDGTCYILLECDLGGSSMCLDWRDICDGRIDCLNGGVDENQCFNLEINECNENEYRCHNGLCIPKTFLEMDFHEPQCLDRSDYLVNSFCARFYFNLNLFECQEFICRPNEGKFPCGDGQCVEDYGQCKNNRHLTLAQSVSVQGNLSYECWISMVCLTKIMDKIKNLSCDQFIQSSKIIDLLKSCKFPLQFPVIPVLYGHVRFLYHLKEIDNIDVTLSLKPDYICYDEQLCDFLTPTFRNGTLTCRSGNQMGLTMNAKLTTWKSIIDSIKPNFDGCITQHYHIIDSHHSSLYHCENSSKYISNYRILDGISDCFLKDDEQAVELSCSLNQTSRFQCPNEKQCRSPLFSKSICSSSIQINHDDIPFYKICDRIMDFPMMAIDGRNHSDETDCEDWQCNNIYTRCDGFRNCLNGKDEEKCTQPINIKHILFCISPHNYPMKCLPADQVSGGAVDCFRGSFVEFNRLIVPNITFQMYKFRCWNDTKCIEDANLCNANEDCPMYDNVLFCDNHPQLCHDSDSDKLINTQDISCQVISKPFPSFSLETALNYPSSYTIQDKSIENHIHYEMITSSSVNKRITQSEICNSGLYVYHRLGIDNYSSLCFCPPNYYGDRCQYQNQRVSLSLTLVAVEQRIIYAITVMLIENDNNQQEIHSYHQFTYEHLAYCGKIVNIYLLYSKRGKDNSKNYSIRIDVFNKDSLTYLTSWHLTIPFVFLPVNRISTFLTIPISRTFDPKNCTLRCYNGTCMKYHNEERFFCQCHSGWSGAQCHIPIDCSMCASNSICIGSIRNRSICVCPQNRFGSLCGLKLMCPVGFCKNNGRCVVLDERMIDGSYVCLCSEQFQGSRCQYINYRIEISLINIDIPSYLLVYIYNQISFEQSIPTSIILKKMTMFQNHVILYIQRMFKMVFVKIDNRYYLAVLQKFERSNITTLISPAQRCASVDEVLNTQFISLPRIQRLKSYHIPCQRDFKLQCFVDEFYMCLCTEEHHSNCFPLDHQLSFVCEVDVYCENGGTCLQDRPICGDILCICTDCFFGDRCQFYANGIGLTLDDLLRYAIRSNNALNNQSLVIKLSATLVMIIFLIGTLNGLFSYLVFHDRDSRKVGCGIYLRLSSVISILVVSMLIIKFWFVTYTYINQSINRTIRRVGCILFEPMLRFFLYMSNWLNTCVGIERAIAVFKGISFNMRQSRRIARRTLCILPLIILGTMSYELIQRDLFDDYEEQRVWCIIRYSQSVQIYTTVVQYFHFVAPVSVNLLATLFIIVKLARQQAIVRTHISYQQQLFNNFNEHKQLVIGPIVLAILLSPRFLISISSGCVKAPRIPWLYLFGYFISFIPSSLIFVIFVLPSTFYKKQFKKVITTGRQRFIRAIRSWNP
ncbi:unnamed protein product [Adineta steineri]|uniref:Uncharacterized protein n=1 Tax=Adineta steineri TaxID=433720 RepID=A0A813PAS9_9BILA|nr:unnamed protein product [Adineta steineri]CAF4077761.1 unnamed protein product [Adineta steineri]